MILWDYNAGAPLLPAVHAQLCSALGETWGNASSVHAVGRRARAHLDEARARVAAALGASSEREIVFTGSGSEAASLAIIGSWLARRARTRRRIVTSQIEHPCVLKALEQVERLGAEVVRVAPNPDGQLDASAVISALDADVLLCSVMWANNETGVIQPVDAIAAACRERGVVFHTDAVQAVGRLAVRVDALPVDLLSLSAHKLGGPSGAGVLFNRRGIDVAALTPGHQENGRRGGTPMVAFAEATALALEHAERHRGADAGHLARLRDRFEADVVRRLGARLNGAGARRVPNTSSVTFPGVDGEALLIALDLDGIAVSAGAACASGSLAPSHVLLAMGLRPTDARGTLRFSLGPDATPEEADAVLGALEAHFPFCRRDRGC